MELVLVLNRKHSFVTNHHFHPHPLSSPLPCFSIVFKIFGNPLKYIILILKFIYLLGTYCITGRTLCSSQKRYNYKVLFYRWWGNWGLERLSNLFKVTKIVNRLGTTSLIIGWMLNWLATDLLIKKQYQGEENNLGDRVSSHYYPVQWTFIEHLLGIHTPRLQRLVFDLADLSYELWITDHVTEKLLWVTKYYSSMQAEHSPLSG